jgi:flagellar hook-associated protein 1 FlgK
MSILSILSIGTQALRAQASGVRTVGHNIANVGTPGFSRQRVELSTAPPESEGGVSFGLGVQLDGVTSVVDELLESELVALKSGVGFERAKSRALGSVESAFPLTGGIEAALDAFFAAVSAVANNPAGAVERVALVGKAQALADILRETRSDLVATQASLDRSLGGAVQRVNDILPQIASLNPQIRLAEADGNRANDLRDRRQVLVQELSELLGVTTFENDEGEIIVLTGGLLLVAGDRFASLDDSTLNPQGFRLVSYQAPGGTTFDATGLLSRGEIGAILEARDTDVAGFIANLDQLAKTLVDEVNLVHAAGYDLNGVTGTDFFDPIGAVPGAAASVRVSAAVTSDPSAIAAAQAPTTLPGDNRNALALAALQDAPVAALGGLTFLDYFLSLVTDIGTKAQNSNDALEFRQALLADAQTRRDSVSGVNLDEEMTNLIQFQRAFEAASRLVRVGDEMYLTLLEMLG